MHNDNWMDDTVPSPRPGLDHSGARGDTPVGRRPAPGGVWILAGVVVLLALAVCGLWALYLLRGQWASGGPTPTPLIWTPTSVPTPAASPTPPPTETSEPTPTVSPDVAIGRYVRVAGTGGYGLSLRSGPGENYARMDVALEGQTFIVVDGPTLSAGSEWWKVRDPENEAREWWAVGNFLEPVEHP